MRGLKLVAPSLTLFYWHSLFLTSSVVTYIPSAVIAQTAGNVPTNATNLPIGSCTPDIPCANGACCNGNTGFCGFGPSFCGSGNCTSNCDAKAECGPFADASNITCPLSVCCSQFGFCGTTEDFCGQGCQSNCGGPTIPTCDAEQNSAETRRIGYYEGWAVSRKCMSYEPEQIAADVLTHINFAFALISPSFQVIEMTKGDSDLWRRTTALKKSRPGLKVFLSIGGWTFNDPPNQHIFSDMVGSAANTNTFIKSILSVMETFAFDGIDVDWEYPVAWDRGGVPADKENYVTFMAAVKSAFAPHNYGLTFTAPSSFWYLQHFDLPGLLKHADWVNVMTYDLHGTWDGHDPFIGFVVGAHTNLTEIDAAFQLYWRVGVDPKQMVMGMGFYGRSFTLASSDCARAGCAWTSGGKEGPCSANSGTLMFSEIESILTTTQAEPVIDDTAAVAYVTWENQWVSWDNLETFAMKMNYANEHCIGGTMIWSVDQDDNNYKYVPASFTSSRDAIIATVPWRPFIETYLALELDLQIRMPPMEFVMLATVVQNLDIFPSGVPDNGNDLFHVDFDPDEGTFTDAVKSESGTKSTFTESENEDSGAFGEIFIDSPKAGSVSSLAVQSDWVITDCDARSDQPQQVPMYCSKSGSEGCQHVFVDGAEHTIVELPKSCGLGPYARVISIEPHPDQNILNQFHSKVKPASESVMLLSFDYNFAAIPSSNGPIYMRADVTDMPGYWDSVVDSPPERREWLQKRGLWKDPKVEKRWWGAFKNWLSKITTLEVDKSQTRTFFWQDTWNIFHQETHCEGPPQFDASLDISLTGNAQMTARYGFYLQGTVVPPAVTAAYVHFSSDASASAQLTLKGEASVTYNSQTVRFASFGFPGLYYPGLLTVGPSLVLEGYITGQLSVQGQMTTGITYKFPPINYALGKTGDDVIGPAAQPSPPNPGYNYQFGLNVDLSGDITIHMVPTVQLGISVLNGALIEAEAYVRADLYAGLAMNGSVSLSSAPRICIIPHYGLIVQGGVTGNVLYWEASTTPFEFYNRDFVFHDGCFGAVNEPVSGSTRRDLGLIEGAAGQLPNITGGKSERGARIIERTLEGGKEINKRDIMPTREVTHDPMLLPTSHHKDASYPLLNATPAGAGESHIQHLTKRIDVPFISGAFSCPAVNDQVGQDNTDNDIYSDAAPPSDNDDEVYRRGLEISPISAVKVASCSQISFDPSDFSNIGNTFYNLASPTTLDGNFKAYPSDVGRVNTNTYGREHVYEMQLLSDFINTLAQSPDLWQNTAGNQNYCSWANSFFNTPSKYSAVNKGKGLSVIDRLKACQPRNTNSAIASGGTMPWLESTANGMKAKAFGGSSNLRTSSTFKRYSFSKKVFEIRAATGLVSYMQDGPVADQFVLVSGCVKGVWSDFYTAYNADTAVDAPNKGSFNMATTYTSYIRSKTQSLFLNLQSGVQQMIGFYATAAGGSSVQKPVDLNFGTLKNPGTSMVSADDLTNSIFSKFSGASFIKITVQL
ncbi:hypothetical protein CVT24_004529 [Panaeolus cyanescens]|uniref:Uncharacterized protein n=1 Tax=Panaeolus cyanescens TaxID=181874 RepID=A0A409YBT9_9AGAR|nr:hypothetical protein CVT24_004529 [Panaeolus cyanescens]